MLKIFFVQLSFLRVSGVPFEFSKSQNTDARNTEESA